MFGIIICGGKKAGFGFGWHTVALPRGSLTGNVGLRWRIFSADVWWVLSVSGRVGFVGHWKVSAGFVFSVLLIQQKHSRMGWCGLFLGSGVGLCVFVEKSVVFCLL